MALPPIMIDVPSPDGGLAAKTVVAAGLKDVIVFVVPDGTERDYEAIVSDPAVATFTSGGDQGGWTARPGLVLNAPGTTDVVLTRDGSTVIAVTVTVLDQPHAGATTEDPALPDLSIAPQTQALADSLPGMSEADAVAAIEAAGLSVRITARDGEDFPITMDYRPDRIDLQIADGRVVTATIG